MRVELSLTFRIMKYNDKDSGTAMAALQGLGGTGGHIRLADPT